MGDILQIILLATGWVTVVVGGLTTWTRLSTRITKLESQIEEISRNISSCLTSVTKKDDDFESRLRALEHRSPDSRTRATDKGER